MRRKREVIADLAPARVMLLLPYRIRVVPGVVVVVVGPPGAGKSAFVDAIRTRARLVVHEDFEGDVEELARGDRGDAVRIAVVHSRRGRRFDLRTMRAWQIATVVVSVEAMRWAVKKSRYDRKLLSGAVPAPIGVQERGP